MSAGGQGDSMVVDSKEDGKAFIMHFRFKRLVLLNKQGGSSEYV